ncbi:MAG TPA: hypothetical protein VN519_11480 [Bryobacteraceae bacterium]|nr:hypothetical protein [Bryobacteraceae bacterium]
MTFPLLKTSAVAQYPLERSLQFSTRTIRFLNGSRQSFRLFGRNLGRWSLRLDLLDETELAELVAFLEAQGSAPFAYSDPITGATAPRCVISGEQFAAGMKGEMDGQARIVIEEIP